MTSPHVTPWRSQLPIDQLLVAWIPTVLPFDQYGRRVRVVTDTPTNLADECPIVQVDRVGGPRFGKLAKPSVDFNCFAVTRIDAAYLAEQIDELMNTQLPTMVLDHVIGFQGSYSGPTWRNYENTFVQRYGMTYGYIVHRAR